MSVLSVFFIPNQNVNFRSIYKNVYLKLIPMYRTPMISNTIFNKFWEILVKKLKCLEHVAQNVSKMIY